MYEIEQRWQQAQESPKLQDSIKRCSEKSPRPSEPPEQQARTSTDSADTIIIIIIIIVIIIIFN